eukprot:GHRQ01037092.1.p1 GENE.GHRQ01037092.1~~GHRQ01037092.1.p1  ORF type:complete len:100 (-),score=24.15 GHRQ01037092.1:342-641(-)
MAQSCNLGAVQQVLHGQGRAPCGKERQAGCCACFFVQAREDIFKLARTEYPLLADITRAFEPTASMWRMSGLFSRQLPDWMDGPFSEIDAEAVSADVDK